MDKLHLLPHYRFENGLKYVDSSLDIPEEQTNALRQHIAGADISEDLATILIKKGILIKQSWPIGEGEKNHVIVSPHSDDVVLSMGGFVLRHTGKIRIVNVFSTCPKCHTFPNMPSCEVTFLNNMEEAFYASLVGASLEFLWHAEALQRGYKNVFTRNVQESDLAMTKYLEASFKPLRKETWYFPLSIGDHVDHVILHNIGRRVAKYARVRFYEDQPYTEEVENFAEHLNERTNGLEVACTIDISNVMNQKVDLACAYKTQYDREYLSKLIVYARRLGDGRAKERLWKLKGRRMK